MTTNRVLLTAMRMTYERMEAASVASRVVQLPRPPGYAAALAKQRADATRTT